MRTMLLLVLLLGASPAFAQTYLSREEALEEVFPDAVSCISDTLEIDTTAAHRLEEELNREPDEAPVEAILCYDASGAFEGYAVITDESGKHRPITFIVGVNPEFAVEKVAIMVYRENRGGQIRTPRFLYQYRGKTARDPIRSNADIINLTGATISVRAINAGVKKVLILLTEHYGANPPGKRPN